MNEYILSASFDRAFPKCSNRKHWLQVYMQLREAGDNHAEAVETIRAEMQMERMTTP